MGDLPAHHQHQAKAEHEEKQSGDGVLNPDDLMVGGKNVSAPEPHIFVVRFLNTWMRNSVSGSHVCYFCPPIKAASLQFIYPAKTQSALVNRTRLPVSTVES